MWWKFWGFLLALGYIKYRATESHRSTQQLGATRSQFRAVKTTSCDGTVLVLTQTMTYQRSSWWGEGSTVDMHSGEAVSFATAKPHVEELQQTFESQQPCKNRTRTFKRSYKRAQKRATEHGITWYRGQWMTPTQLGTQYKGNCSVTPKTKNVSVSAGHKRKRLTVLCWNSGGLPSADWDWVQHWLTQQSIDVIAIQESHWPFTNEWQQRDFYCFHSGCSSRSGGLLTLISKRLCHSDAISWAEPIPGRLMHIRIHGQNRSIDIVNAYQHVHAQDRLEDRTTFWTTLQTTLHQIPKRNNLIMLGDWNTSLTRSTTAIGLPTYVQDDRRCQGPQHSDSHVFHNILLQHDLIAVNTWQHGLGPTYRFQNKHSRIDYVICRPHFSDTTSKGVQYLHDFPLNSLDGAQHFPILASLLKVWHHTPTAPKKGWTLKQRLDLYKRWRYPTNQTIQLQQEINDAVQRLPSDGDCLDTIHKTLNDFGHQAPLERPTTWYDTNLQPFQLFQVHSKWLAELTTPALKSCLQAWNHVARRGHARKMMRAASKHARRERIQRLFDLAGHAERAHDHFTLYQVIRELAPKKPFRKIQICNSQGTMLNPVEAADELQTWFEALYNDAGTQIPATSFNWPFTKHELAAGFHDLPLLKALTPESAPAPYWQCAAEPIADQLTSYLTSCGEQGQFPDCWSKGTLFFIPKNAKRRLQPKELRPITLLEPCNKVCMGILAQRIQSEAGNYLNTLPQFAYTKMRGGDDALHRIVLHCNHVRQLCDSQKYIRHCLAQGGHIMQYVEAYCSASTSLRPSTT